MGQAGGVVRGPLLPLLLIARLALFVPDNRENNYGEEK